MPRQTITKVLAQSYLFTYLNIKFLRTRISTWLRLKLDPIGRVCSLHGVLMIDWSVSRVDDVLASLLLVVQGQAWVEEYECPDPECSRVFDDENKLKQNSLSRQRGAPSWFLW